MRCATERGVPADWLGTNPRRPAIGRTQRIRWGSQHQISGAELEMGGDDEVPVVGPGKALGLARAAMVRQQMVVRVGMTSGPVGHYRRCWPGSRSRSGPHHLSGPACGLSAASAPYPPRP